MIAMFSPGHRGYSQAPFPETIYLNIEQGLQQAKQVTDALREVNEKDVAAAYAAAKAAFAEWKETTPSERQICRVSSAKLRGPARLSEATPLATNFFASPA
jgi:hypothetical protein